MSKFLRVFGLLGSTFLAAEAAESPMDLGTALPGVGQRNQDGQMVRLADFGTKGFLLVYFYPKADTPGCTRQACSLRDAFADLTTKGVTVLGVSTDKPTVQKAFKDKYQLPFDLLADEDGSVLRAFGVPKVLGFAKRQAFLFKDGKLVWRDLSAATEQQAADVLRVVNER